MWFFSIESHIKSCVTLFLVSLTHTFTHSLLLWLFSSLRPRRFETVRARFIKKTTCKGRQINRTNAHIKFKLSSYPFTSDSLVKFFLICLLMITFSVFRFRFFFFGANEKFPSFVARRILTIWAQLHRQWCFISLDERKWKKYD